MNRARLLTKVTVPSNPPGGMFTVPMGAIVDILRDRGGLDTRLVIVWVHEIGARRLLPANVLEVLP